MTQPEQGIDMSRSGWTNPEGLQRAPRPAVHVEQVKACEAPGPDGWVCDLKPGHGPNHYADDGSPEGLRWTGAMAETTSHQEMVRGEQSFVPAYREPAAALTDLGKIESIARKAIASQMPAAWAIALNEILELCHGNAR